MRNGFCPPLSQPRGRLPPPARQNQEDAGADPGGEPAARYTRQGVRRGRRRISADSLEEWKEKPTQAARAEGAGKRGKRVGLVCGMTSMYTGLDGLMAIVRADSAGRPRFPPDQCASDFLKVCLARRSTPLWKQPKLTAFPYLKPLLARRPGGIPVEPCLPWHPSVQSLCK